MALGALAVLVGCALVNTEVQAEPGDGARPGVIRVIEHPGYFETLDGVFQIEGGTYTFEVDNQSGKDAGFVLAKEGEEPHVIVIEEGATGTLTVELSAGAYTYSCPLIPTPPYPLQVQ